MIMLVLSAVLTVLSVGVAVAQVLTGDEEILPAGARLEVLHEGAFFTEGAAVAPDGSVYFSDITFTFASGEPPEAGHILRYDPATGETSVFRSPSGMSNGLKFDAQGRLLACEGADHGGRRVTRTDPDHGQGGDPGQPLQRLPTQRTERPGWQYATPLAPGYGSIHRRAKSGPTYRRRSCRRTSPSATAPQRRRSM